MRILMVNGYPLGQSGSGGAEGHVATLCTLLREAGHEVPVRTSGLDVFTSLWNLGRALISAFATRAFSVFALDEHFAAAIRIHWVLDSS